MKIKLFLILLSLFLSFTFKTHGQQIGNILENNTLKFEKLKRNEGLFHNSITTIYQDSKGYMWFGSFNGLYKYDGYRFHLYKNNVDDKNSLIGNNILTINEDNEGKLWIGTKNGLCWYDKSSDQFFSKILNYESQKKQVISKTINSIYQDSYKSLWVGTNNGLYQLVKKDNGYHIFLHKTNKLKSGLSHNRVNTIIEDSSNSIWVGTNNGLNKITINRQGKLLFNHFFSSSKQHKSISNNFITSLLKDSLNNIWIGTKHGLNKLTYSKDGKVNFINFYAEDGNIKSLSDNYISALSEDKNGSIWVGTRHKGVSVYSKNKFENYKKNLHDETSLSSNEVSSIYSDKYGVLWIGVISGALNKLDLKKKNIAHFKHNPLNNNSLSDNIVNDIFEDSSSSIWVATHNAGLNKLKFENGYFSFIRYLHDPENNNSLSSNNIFSICEDNFGNLWVGTETKGLNKIQISKNNEKIAVSRYTKEQTALKSNNISVMLKDKLGDIWMGSFDGDGLMRFTPTSNNRLPTVHSYKNIKTENTTLSSDNISYLYEDSESILWVGTYGGGLIKVARDANNTPKDYLVIKNITGDKSSLSSNNVFSILEDKNKNLWVATFGGGLNKITNTERKKENPKIIRFNKEHGLTNDELYSIIDDVDGNLWVSSNRGIYKFNIKEEKFTNYNTNDGLQSSNFRKFAFCKGRDSLLYFGGINGFNVFNPKQLIPNKYIPDIEIVDFKVFNKSVKPRDTIAGKVVLKNAISETKDIVLDKKLNAFSFEFSGLHYVSPSQNTYQYMLEGFDKTWNKTDSKRRYAAYSNLDAGTYTFKVKASNNDDIWNNTPKELKITIRPFWWNTWWAYMLYSIAGIGLMLLFRHFTVINHEYQNKLKIEKIEQENIKRMNAAKLEFFTNISHEFKTPLTLILGPLQHLTTAQNLDLKVKNTLLSVERNANNLYKLINQVLEFRQIETKEIILKESKGDLVAYIKEIINSFYFLTESKDIKLIFQSNTPSVITNFDNDKVEKIINNLVSNCVKYTEENGEITVSLNFKNNARNRETIDEVEVVVEDNGVGIPKNQIALIFNRFYKIDKLNRSNSMGSGIGLALTKSLVELLGGTISVESKEFQGSIFKIILPLSDTIIKSEGEILKNKVSKQFIEHSNLEVFDSQEKINESLLINEKANDGETISLPILLVIEDNHELQHFIKDTLSGYYNIKQAFDGQKGHEMAINEVPDIIISDIMLPYKDGIEICDSIKKNDITNHVPIVLLTARASIEHRIEGLEVGADAYIAKPFHIKHLKITLSKLLKQREVLKEKFSISDEIQKPSNNLNKFEAEFIERIKSVISENIQNPQFGVTELGDALNFSRMQLYRKLKSISDMSANEFIRDFRIKRAAKTMIETELNISEIAYDVGFNNLSYFTKCFKKVYKVSPSVYIKENKR